MMNTIPAFKFFYYNTIMRKYYKNDKKSYFNEFYQRNLLIKYLW